MLAAGDLDGAAIPSVAERRQSLRDLAELAGDPIPPSLACEDLACPLPGGETLAMRRYTPRGAINGPGPALLYLHGGGWVAGDLDTHAGVCAALAQAADCSVFALHYRRPPEHPFPGPMHDALHALAWLRKRAGSLGVDADRIGLAGDSAGGNLAAAAALDPRAAGLALLLLICPILDLPRTDGSRAAFARGHFLSADRLAADIEDHLRGADPADPRASPLRAPDLARLPPTLIHAAECDPFRDEALALADRLQAVGVPASATLHPGMIHYFYALPRAIPRARAALAEMGAQAAEALQR